LTFGILYTVVIRLFPHENALPRILGTKKAAVINPLMLKKQSKLIHYSPMSDTTLRSEP